MTFANDKGLEDRPRTANINDPALGGQFCAEALGIGHAVSACRRAGPGRPPNSAVGTDMMKSMKGIVGPALATAVLALSACASYPPASPPPLAQIFAPDEVMTESVKAEREAVSTVYSSCLARAAKRFDDYKSDPTSIARAIMSACNADELVDSNRKLREPCARPTWTARYNSCLRTGKVC
jgi:hypothetical protein